MNERKTTLRDLREEAGKTISDVAKALAVTPQAVSNYEAGIRAISLEQVLVLSVLLAEPAEEIIKAQLNSRYVREENLPIPQKNHRA